MKKRLDQILVGKGFAGSIQKAQALILAGSVLVNEQKLDKAGTLVEEAAAIRLKNAATEFVSRGGTKLAHALDHFQINPTDKICMDVGVSTGGFTDCLLQRGAKKIVAVDVGYGQLDWKIRNDPRVIVLERENIRHLAKEKVPDAIDLVVIDVSFISLKLVFPAIQTFLTPSPFPPPSRGGGRGKVIALVKPQFEVAPEEVGPGGIVKDPKLHQECVEAIQKAGEALGWKCAGSTPSPILGADGNREFFLLFEKPLT